MRAFLRNTSCVKKSRIRHLLLLVFFLAAYSSSYADYVKNEPITLKQPNGIEINIFVSGDEYYSWLHDEYGYTIIQNPTTGYYCYALLEEDELIASSYIVGQTDPKSTSLQPHIRISNKKIQEKMLMFINSTSVTVPKSSKGSTSGTLNNIVIYIRFSDQPEFPAEQSKYTAMFNNETGNSMKNYFKEVSYGQMNIQSHFYPTNNGSVIVSYQDPHTRDYYCPYSTYNTLGYVDFDERTAREHTLLANAIETVKSQIPTSLNLDYDNNGYVDNVCFIIRGMYDPTGILWSHRWQLFSKTVQLNGKRVYDYNVQIEARLNTGGVGTLCHEMGHTFSAPDLYHENQDCNPVEKWDLMSNNLNPPQYMSAYVRYKYTGWISTIPTISKPGTYTLYPLSSSSNNCYKIPLKNSDEYLVVEYRKKEGTFEKQIYGSGLLVYRINENKSNIYATGCGGVNDRVYIFRPGGSVSSDGTISKAHFSSAAKRTKFNASTNPACFISDGSGRNVFLWNIKENTDGTLSFKFSYCGEDDDKIFSNTSNLPAYTKVTSSIQTEGTVIVKSSDNVTFEAAESISLGEGFEVEEGGTFNVIIYDCD